MKYESGNILQGIRNADLVCRDCRHKFDDSVMLGNTSKCEEYTLKPVSVLSGGNCLMFEKRD